MGGKGGSSQIEVNHYLMSLHLGICRGPVDAITAAYYGEKRYWSGYATVNQSYSVSNPGLFGGDKKEGGVQGVMTFLMGKSDQVLPNNIAQKFGRSSGLDCPGFRGITSVFHTGPASSGRAGWMWCANSPYLKGMWYTVMAIPKSLGEANSKLNPTNGFTPTPITWQGLYGFEVETTPGGASSPYAQMAGKIFTLQQALDYADQLVPANAPHWANSINFGNCKVPTGAVSKADGYVYARYEPTGNPIIASAGNYGMQYLREVFYTGVGKQVVATVPASGETARPTRPTIYTETTQYVYDANPAHIIYEVMTNRDYGMGQDPVTINTQSFVNAAATLAGEGLGLSMAWSTSTTALDFIEEVKQHINALIFSDPETGKMTIKLVRDDYDVNTLRTVNPDNANMTSFSRKAWGDTINEIVVTWTNPASEQEETVTLQDNGNIAEQGELVSDAKNYYGVRSASLAWKLAARDLRAAAAPLCSAEVELDRSFWNLRPGDCLKVTWPEYGMTDLVMRVWEVKYGSGRRGSSRIVALLTEDIFSLPVGSFVQPPTSEWVDLSKEPEPFSTAKVITLPVYMAAKIGGVSAGSFEYPVAYAGVLGAAPNADTGTFELRGQTLDPTGATIWQSLGTRVVTGYGTLTTGLVAEAITAAASFTLNSGNGPGQSVFALIGGGSDSQSEIALITGESGSNWQLKRGVLDTVPRAWPAGTPVWFMTSDFLFADQTQQSAGSQPNYKLLANTSLGQLSDSAATIITSTLTDRIHLPLRPANLKVDGVGFGQVTMGMTGKVYVTWSRRNRLTEETVVIGWGDADVTPEAGQTTALVLTDADSGTEVGRVSGLTGVSHEVDILAALYGGTPSAVMVSAVSERDGMESLQSHSVKVLLPGGYGQDYGNYYR